MQDTQQSKRKQMTTTNNGKTERQPVTAVAVAQLPKVLRWLYSAL